MRELHRVIYVKIDSYWAFQTACNNIHVVGDCVKTMLLYTATSTNQEE